jgi:hypothetical protein
MPLSVAVDAARGDRGVSGAPIETMAEGPYPGTDARASWPTR